MGITGHAIVAEITPPPSISEDGGVRKTSDTNGGGRVGAVVVDVGPDQHQALQHAECKARTYGKALFGLASLLCLSVCGNLASSALSILVFKQSRFSGAIQQPSDSKAATPVATGLTSHAGTGLKNVTTPFEVPTYVTPADFEPPVVATAPSDDSVPLGISLLGLKRCAIASSGTEACWELADPAITDIPDDFLNYNTYLYLDIAIDDITASAFAWTKLAGTLKVGPAVKTIGTSAFARTKFRGVLYSLYSV